MFFLKRAETVSAGSELPMHIENYLLDLQKGNQLSLRQTSRLVIYFASEPEKLKLTLLDPKFKKGFSNELIKKIAVQNDESCNLLVDIFQSDSQSVLLTELKNIKTSNEALKKINHPE